MKNMKSHSHFNYRSTKRSLSLFLYDLSILNKSGLRAMNVAERTIESVQDKRARSLETRGRDFNMLCDYC